MMCGLLIPMRMRSHWLLIPMTSLLVEPQLEVHGLRYPEACAVV